MPMEGGVQEAPSEGTASPLTVRIWTSCKLIAEGLMTAPGGQKPARFLQKFQFFQQNSYLQETKLSYKFV